LNSSVFDAKHLIGRKFNDAEVQSDLKHFPFKCFSKGGKPYISVEYCGKEKASVSIPSFALRIKTDQTFFISSHPKKSQDKLRRFWCPALHNHSNFSPTSSSCLKLSVSTLAQPTRKHLTQSLYPFHCAYVSFSCVGVWQNDHVEIIANDQGNCTTPSYVSFSDNERLIGDAAKNQVAMNPHNTYVYLSLYFLI
jgi:ribosomal protein L28